MSDSDIQVDSEGMEVRSEDDSDSGDSINDFLTESTEEEEEDDSDPEWFPPPKDKKRISVKPVRFADEVFDSSEEEETSDESESE